jgi:hypothetical protein
VVALHIGFLVEIIDVFQGFFRTTRDLDATDRTDEERYVFPAAGTSAETVGLGRYCATAERQ